MTKLPTLENQIDDVVRQYVDQVRQAAIEAVERAFAAVAPAQRPQTTTRESASAMGPRRTPEEMAALSSRFYDAVCANPGEAMKQLARKVGATPHALQVPVARLKREGRIRTAGQRQFTSYFPSVAKAEAA